MITVKKILDYTIPLFGNKRCMPYGTLLVTDGTTEKRARIMGDGANQYITFKRKHYPVKRHGDLYHPHFEIVQEATA